MTYSPVARGADGSATVVLGEDHPGFADPAYRARRDAIAALALGWAPGAPLPSVAYTDEEHATWAAVHTALRRAWASTATRSFLEGVEALDLPVDHVPQLAEVGDRLERRSGFRHQPAAGLVPLRDFYGAFAADRFWSTQYLRHGSSPLYTPEPDVCHEVLGHAHQLADPRWADLYRRVAAATARSETDEALGALSRIFWFTVEFGVVREGGEVRTCGAGLLSSVGELGAFRDAELRPLDWAAMATATYDITRFQPVLHLAGSEAELLERLGELVDGWDDDAHQRLVAPATARAG